MTSKKMKKLEDKLEKRLADRLEERLLDRLEKRLLDRLEKRLAERLCANEGDLGDLDDSAEIDESDLETIVGGVGEPTAIDPPIKLPEL